MNANANQYNGNSYGGVNGNNDVWKQADFYSNDAENGQQYKVIDHELNMRLGFIRKVYGILSAQLLLTTLMCVLSITSKSYATFQITHPAFLWVSIIASIVILLAICCVPGVSRQVPLNYCLLFAFTFFEGYMVSALCAKTDPRLVLMAAAMTSAITIALTLYACTTKTDFTLYGSILFICSCCLMLMGIFAMFFKFMHVVVCTLGIFLYAVYLVYDTQLMMGNKENSLDVEDYILGALMLYLDIINMFIYILNILKFISGDN